MRTKEQRLWDRLRKAAAGRIHTERIENVVGVGRPDVDTLCAGSFVPIELKAVETWPRRATTRVLGDAGLSQDQKNWHLTWRRWGGTSLIVVGVGEEVYGFMSGHADALNDMNKNEFLSAAAFRSLDALIDQLESWSK